MIDYLNQIDYLQQEEDKIRQRLNHIYKVNSNESWLLEAFHRYTQKTACDYPGCPRSSIKNGIKNVFRVVNIQSQLKLNLGSECYFKLLNNSQSTDLNTKEKAKVLVKHVIKEQKYLTKNTEEIAILAKKLLLNVKDMQDKLNQFGIDLDQDIADNSKDLSYTNLKKLVKLLDNAITKYTIERHRLKELQHDHFCYYENNQKELLLIDTETGEILRRFT